jgi:hypothetical protein
LNSRELRRFPSMNRSHDRYWPWFFFAAAFESLLAIIALLLIPSEGVSLARLALLGILSLFLAAGTFFGLRARAASLDLNSCARPIVIYSAALLTLTSGLALFLLRYLNPERLLPYYERLSPLLWYLLVLGVQSTFFLLAARNGLHPEDVKKRGPVYRAGLMALAVLSAIFLFVLITKIGIVPDAAYWGEPGVAILGWQMALSLLAGLVILLWSRKSFPRFAGMYLPLGIYVLACILWLSVPMSVLENSFYAPITPPANTPFPYSDAGFYDYLSQSLLIGSDYLGGIPPRPLYITFLAFLHLILGQNYPAIIAAQTFVLALFPIILYFLGKKLHSPAAGTVVALFAIFRELVGLWISSNTRVANSRIFTTDFPTALGIAALCLVIIWWFERRDLKSTLVAGGAFGLLLLFRTQSLFILPVILILAWFVYQRKTIAWMSTCLVFITAMILTVLPWLVHNYTVSGQFSFDDPQQVSIISSQYSFNSDLGATPFDPSRGSVFRHMAAFTLENPGYVTRFILTHFLNTEIGGLLSLPLIKRYDGLFAPVNLYWVGWNGSLEWYNLVLLGIYLTVIAVGLGTAWRRARWLGLVPLAFNLGYAIANGISRFSSWRYNLPVDWVVYFYLALGAMELFVGAALLFGAKDKMESGSIGPGRSTDFSIREFRPQYVWIVIAFAFVGGLPWLAQGLAQPRYTSTSSELVAQLESNGHSAEAIAAFLEHPDAVLLEGRLLYPRLYRRDLGIASANPWPAYAVRDYARIGFVLINQRQYSAIFMTRDLLDFPHAADTIVLGCQREEYIEVRLVDFGGEWFQSAPLTQHCE